MTKACLQEERIVRALVGGDDLEPFDEHLGQCASCRETMTAASWLQGVARKTERSTALPEADAIWWRAQVVNRLCDQEDRSERRGRPLMLAQITAGMIAVVSVTALALSSESVNNGIGELAGVLGGSGAVLLAVAGIASMLTGGFVAWQVARDLG